MPLTAMEQHHLEDLLDEIEALKDNVQEMLDTNNSSRISKLQVERRLGSVYGIAGEMALNQDISWTNVVNFTTLKQKTYHHFNS